MEEFIALGPRHRDLTGQRFGRLVALGPIEQRARQATLWLCQCDCGNATTVAGRNLGSGNTQSCGCLRLERVVAASKIHGLEKHPLYQTRSSIIKRCTNSGRHDYARYGGRGITICDEWHRDFQAFYDHVSTLPHCGEKGYSLDRIDNDRGYEPGNVRWSTSMEQARNRRTTHLITFGDVTMCRADWESHLGLPKGILCKRLNQGWDIERALTTPSRIRGAK